MCSLTGPDSIGVLTEVTDVVLEAGGNVTDSRSFVMSGIGVMGLLVEIPVDHEPESFRSALAGALPSFNVHVQPCFALPAAFPTKTPFRGRCSAARGREQTAWSRSRHTSTALPHLRRASLRQHTALAT